MDGSEQENWTYLINQALLTLDAYLGSSVYFPFILLGVGLFFSFYLGLPQIRFFYRSCLILTGTSTEKDKDAIGDISPFQALATALSGTIGTGNIGGVAFAIYLGGPAALFWMWVTAFLGMTIKFVEVTLSCQYRERASDGTLSGGPMYYMDKALNMKWLACLFSLATLMCSFGIGSMPQSNNIAMSLEQSFSLSPTITGLLLASLLAMVILGGIRRIALVTSFLTPMMSGVYVIGALSVIIYNFDQLGPSLQQVWHDAFTGTAATGGFLGASFAYAFNRGINRGLFSNEAGMGSAPIVHASAEIRHPVEEGMVSLLEPFIDTLVICTLTGLTILCSGVWHEKHANTFQHTDMVFIQGDDWESTAQKKHELFYFLSQDKTSVTAYTGTIEVQAGRSMTLGYSLLAARSIAEDVFFSLNDQPFSGTLKVVEGALTSSQVEVSGRSLIHSTLLTSLAFQQGYLGQWGQYIVTLGLLLFAFSTSISWSYYGDRAVVYLLGVQAVLPFRCVYVLSFWLASTLDTVMVWNIAAIAAVCMALPNLFAICALHREVKAATDKYWRHHR
mgnify:CR=1 FL=1|tara:strand:- start:275 stop:1957 length:1683 start_codon:yes stop_codon:yes gene_type:complete